MGTARLGTPGSIGHRPSETRAGYANPALPERAGLRRHTLAEFDAEVRKFADAAPHAKLWFRGHESATWHLRPPALRDSMPHKARDYVRRECHMFVELKRRGIALVDSPPRSDWGWLYLAQHHGVPTRLLDWSEGSHLALYFALANRKEDDTSDACVWMLNPGELNRRSRGFSDVVTLETKHPEPAILLNPYRDGTQSYRQAATLRIFKAGSRRAIRKTATKRAQCILAAIPEHVTPRLRAQRGAFVAVADDPDAISPNCSRRASSTRRSAPGPHRRLQLRVAGAGVGPGGRRRQHSVPGHDRLRRRARPPPQLMALVNLAGSAPRLAAGAPVLPGQDDKEHDGGELVGFGHAGGDAADLRP